MSEKEKTSAADSPESTAPETPLIIGEKGFSVVLLLLGIAALALSLELWSRMSAPKISSAAGVPVIVTAAWTILALLGVIGNLKYKSPLSNLGSFPEKAKKTIEYIMPLDVFVTILAILVYCVALYLGLSFYIASALFLYGMMCYLARGSLGKNALWTGLVLLFIFVVFRLLFQVIFPN